LKIDILEIANFRKLKSVRIDVSDKTTVFVGANNSGKTSAMIALRYFLVERDRERFSLNDFTLSHWPTIDAIGKKLERVEDVDRPQPEWRAILPSLDVWLRIEKIEAYFVQKLIPTLDWDGERLGVRLRLEPKDISQLQKDYLTVREEAKCIEEADQRSDDGKENKKRKNLILWPRTLSEFLQRRFGSVFNVKSYILDPEKLVGPKNGEASPQTLAENAIPIDGEPFKGLIRIDEISAQRGFGQTDEAKDFDDDGALAGSSATRRMSDQLRRYWNRHLDPFKTPDPKDMEALRAIEQAQQAFDERLRDGFSAAIREVEGMGHPGVTDPKLKISSQLKPVDGLNHDAAVQYVISAADGENGFELNLPENSNGLGYQNLIYMIFRLMSFRDAWMRVGKAAARSGGTSDIIIPRLHLVLIEEPEVHLHTQVQQVFIRKAYEVLRKHKELGKKGEFKTQLIVSTHSSHIAHECEFDDLRYFRRLPPLETSVPLSWVVNLGAVFNDNVEAKRFVSRYIKVAHCDLFFADAAVFVEGAAERILVPFFIRHNTELSSLREHYITWLEIGGSHSHRFKTLIEHLGLTTLIITDLDAMSAEENGEKALPERGAKLKTRNHTLKSWCPEKEDLDTLLNLHPDKKSKRYDEQQFAIRVAYQSPVKIEFKDSEDEVVCDTLEDALVMENINLFKEKENEGRGLWRKFKSAIENSKDINELKKSIVDALKNGGKAEFALGLLELKKPEALTPPSYILEGLNWLLAQLNQRQEELGIAENKTGDQ